MANLQLEPETRISFNAPFLVRQKTAMRLTNNGTSPLMYRIAVTSPRRYKVDVGNGALDVGCSQVIVVYLQPLKYNAAMRDTITVEYCQIPSGLPLTYEPKVLAESDMVYRKALPVHFNV